MKLKENRGVTLIALTVTIIVLLIIAGIAVYNGRETIQKANLEAIRTNMLLIEAKARGLVEEANFQLGPEFANEPDESKLTTVRESLYGTKKGEEGNNLVPITSTENEVAIKAKQSVSANSGIPTGDNVYVFTENTAKLWALEDVYGNPEKDGYYLIEFNENEATVEIYNTLGYQGHYSLTEIDGI